jgi:tetratricopeptide (TPR) repeat protein
MLDVIEDDFLHLSNSCSWHVSEYHETLIEQMKRHKVFKPYEGRVLFDVMDCTEPSFPHPPHVTILSYVFDSLPTRSIEYEDGCLYEVLVKTSLKEDAILIDTSDCPPRVLDPNDIKHLLEGPLSDRKKSLLGRLSECLQEEILRVPIATCDMTVEERVFLESFITDLAPDTPIRFNFSYAMAQSLHNIFKQSPEKSLLLAYDFGFTINNPNFDWNHMTGSFGACEFYSVFVPLMRYVAKAFHLDINVTPYEQGHSQVISFSKGVSAPHMQAAFHRQFNKEGHLDAQALSAELSTFSHDKDTFLSSLLARLSTLSTYEKENYSLLMTLAKACQKRKALDEAKNYAQRAIKHYGDFAITAKHLLADIYQQEGDFTSAHTLINEGLDCAHDYYGLHHMNAIIAGKEEQSTQFIQSARYCLAFAPSHGTIIWDHLITLALIYIKTNNVHEARIIFLWIANTALYYPDCIPNYIVARATSITERFETLFI